MALTQDDIAFISFNADEDGWSIVTFVDIDPNTTIYFTDNEATSLTAFNTRESYFQWNSGVNTINAGTVIRFSAIDNAARLAALSIGTFSRVSVSGSSKYGLSASGDTIYAYLGSSANSPTVFLSGISNDTNSQGTTDLTAAGLTIGTNSILLNSSADYGVYNGSRNGESSFATYKLPVNNVNNWIVDTVNGDYTTTVPNTTNFAIADSATPVENLTVTVTSGNTAVVPNGNIMLTGTGVNRNLKINPVVVDASTTFQTLIDAITAAGGPTYQYRQINPVDDTNGGEPGGNIRVGFLFNPNRVSFVDRPCGTSTSNTTVSNVSDVPTVSNSPGLIDPSNSAFTSSRKPLIGEFTFNGKTVYIIGNHFNSKGGDQPLYGPNQPPTLTSEVQRQQQATVVKNFVESILAINPNANVVVAGDLNDFEFSNPVSILESAGLTSLIKTLPQNQRYTYNFEGNVQTLDHVLVSNNLRSKLDGYDVVHVNSEFAAQDSDHDPSVARFNLAKNNAPTVQPLDDQIISTNKPFSFNVSNKFADIDGHTFIYSATGLPTGSSIVANTGVIFGTISQIGIFGVTVTAADGQGGNVSDTFDLTVANNKATSGNDIIFFSELTDFKKYIVHALAGSDRVIGTDNNELIDGGSGNDYLDGKGSADILLGGDGNDTILGGLGSDGLSGGNDNDRLIAWGGGTNEIDLLNGEQGADTYILGDATSVFYTNSRNNDYAHILNFQASDRIQLKGVANNYSLGSVRSAVGIFTNNGAELVAVVENGFNRNTNLATDTRFVFV